MTDLLQKYLAPGEDWEKLSDRVSGIMPCRDEREEVFEVIYTKKLLPNSPALINAGRPGGRNMVACNIFHVPNSIEGIFQTVKDCAVLFKSGAGVGLELSALSPHGTGLKYAPQGIASGPVSFLGNFNEAGHTVMEGGLRRAAIGGLLAITHPDAPLYIVCKEEDGRLENFNISVSMENGPKEVDSELLDLAIKHARSNGEPGFVFLDNINATNPTLEDFGRIIAVNACFEYPGYKDSNCVLSSANLPACLPKGLADWDIFRETIKVAVRFLNRIIDVNHYPLPQLAQEARRTRDIGVGVMGWADLLKREGIPYTSQAALDLATEIGTRLQVITENESWRLAEERGGYLPNHPHNRVTRAIAPTGHLHRIAGVSPSINPQYDEAMRMTADQHLRMVATWQKHIDSSVSYTVCFPNDAPVSFVEEIVWGAHARGLKAISVYRDGSREGQPYCRLDGDCG